MRKPLLALLVVAVVIAGLVVAAHQLDFTGLIRQMHGG
jgi:hypothetical protein